MSGRLRHLVQHVSDAAGGIIAVAGRRVICVVQGGDAIVGVVIQTVVDCGPTFNRSQPILGIPLKCSAKSLGVGNGADASAIIVNDFEGAAFAGCDQQTLRLDRDFCTASGSIFEQNVDSGILARFQTLLSKLPKMLLADKCGPDRAPAWPTTGRIFASASNCCFLISIGSAMC